MFLTYQYRLRPTRRQHAALARILEGERLLYNAALEERIGAWRNAKKSIGYTHQSSQLTAIRADNPDSYGALPVALSRHTLQRINKAFQRFFARVKAKAHRAGFPRFKGQSRWRSFGFAEWSGIALEGKRLRFKGLPGSLRLHMHRDMPEAAALKAALFTRDAKGWCVSLQVEVPDPEPANDDSRPMVGVDLGLNAFAALSDGRRIDNPQIGRRAARKLRVRQRALARCRRGSKRRAKVKASLARAHAKVADARATHSHVISAKLAHEHALIAAEKLNVRGMVRHPNLARAIHDVAWGRFIERLTYKAARAGGRVVLVDPRNTSQECSECGASVPKGLSVRLHSCDLCGLVLDRDCNAARTILRRAVLGPGPPNVTRRGERAAGNISLKNSN